MKKTIMLTAVLLMGAVSIFAQNAWEVKVEWSFSPDSDCHTQLTSNHGYIVFITIYDAANETTVVQNIYNLEDWTDLESTFTGAQTTVQAYCNDSHTYTPSFNVYATVRIYHLSTQSVLCYESESTSGWSCNDFSNGNVLLNGINFD